LREAFKNHFRLVHRDPDTRIHDLEPKPPGFAARVRLDAQDDRALLGEFQRVSDEIDQNLPQPVRIPYQSRGNARKNLNGEL
jgi:hypothetical protein